MFNFLLGVADQQSNSQAVTEQKFTELENSIYERMKDVQDMAHTIQSDQITFLNDQITTFYTIIGIAVAVLTALGGWAITSISKANKKAEQHMQLASTMMENAQTLSQEAEEKIKLLQEEQASLRILLDSKDLDAKLNTLERTAEVTSRLELQMKASTHLQQAKFLVNRATETYTDPVFEEIWRNDKLISKKRGQGLAEIERLNFQINQMQNEMDLFGNNPDLFNKKQIEKEAKGLRNHAEIIQQEASNYYFEYILPVIERRAEKGD